MQIRPRASSLFRSCPCLPLRTPACTHAHCPASLPSPCPLNNTHHKKRTQLTTSSCIACLYTCTFTCVRSTVETATLVLSVPLPTTAFLSTSSISSATARCTSLVQRASYNLIILFLKNAIPPAFMYLEGHSWRLTRPARCGILTIHLRADVRMAVTSLGPIGHHGVIGVLLARDVRALLSIVRSPCL